MCVWYFHIIYLFIRLFCNLYFIAKASSRDTISSYSQPMGFLSFVLYLLQSHPNPSATEHLTVAEEDSQLLWLFTFQSHDHKFYMGLQRSAGLLYCPKVSHPLSLDHCCYLCLHKYCYPFYRSNRIEIKPQTLQSTKS